MTAVIILSAQDLEMAEMLGMDPEKWVEEKRFIQSAGSTISRLAKLYALHRGKRKPARMDFDAAFYAVNEITKLGWALTRPPAWDQEAPSAS